MDHSLNCPIRIFQNGGWHSTQKPYCNCNKIADSNPDNFQKVLTPIHPYNCQHDWRVDKTVGGIIVCGKCGQIENISQKEESKIAESGCTHQFKFSHQSQEVISIGTVYQIAYYVICEKCGLVKNQIGI